MGAAGSVVSVEESKRLSMEWGCVSIDALSFDPNLPPLTFPSFQNAPKPKPKPKHYQPGDDPGSILTIHVDPSIHVRREVAAAAAAGGSGGAAATASSSSASSASQHAPPSSDLDPILAQLRSLDLGAPLLGEKAGTEDPEWAELLHAASGVQEKEKEKSSSAAGAGAASSASSARPRTPPSPRALPAAAAAASASSFSSSQSAAPGSSARGRAASASAALSLRFRDWGAQRSALAAQRQSLVSQRLADADAAASRAATSIGRSRDVLEGAGSAAERAAEVVGDLEGAEALAKKLRASLEALVEEVEGC
mgnify:CR=1 FL=1|jgi:hypothetical protein